MYIRYETIRNSNAVLIIDEVGKFKGEITLPNLVGCMVPDSDPLEEDEYTYWLVDKNKLTKQLKK